MNNLDVFRMMNDEIKDLRAFKKLAIELANRKGFDSVNDALNSIGNCDCSKENQVLYNLLFEIWRSDKPLNLVINERLEK